MSISRVVLPDLKNMSLDEQMDFLHRKNRIDLGTRRFVASSPYALPLVVRHLLEDPAAEVRATVANRQERATEANNHFLRRDRSPMVTQSIACNPLTAEYTIIDLSWFNKDRMTLLYILENPNTPEDVRERLTRQIFN